MVFSSTVFLFLFLPIVLSIYFMCPRGAGRNLCLMAFSALFYAWGEGHFLWVVLAFIGINYLLSLGLEKRRGTPAGRNLLALSIAFNLSFLGVLKYGGFLIANVDRASRVFGLRPVPWRTFASPIGVSFIVFHALSYLIDVSRGKNPAQKDPLRLSLYLLLFPQLVAGPIVRYHDLADQLGDRASTAPDVADGFRRFIRGLAKKILIANVVALPADSIFGLDPARLTAPLAWFGALCYTIQIYFDFSGYSDMAIGLGRVFGFRFPENFDDPYTALSIREFWRRWHISLSTWFRDYLYIPLGGNRDSSRRTALNLFVVFFLCGLWHGAKWTFVSWGLVHGFFLSLERGRFGRWLAGGPEALQRGYALAVVIGGWVLFRAASLSHALSFFKSMLLPSAANVPGLPLATLANREVLIAMAAGILFSTGFPARWWESFQRGPSAPREPSGALLRHGLGAAAHVFLFLMSASWLAAGTYNPFIYFRF